MILDIVTYPAASLKEKCVPVTEITDEIRQLAADMLETMYEAPGVGWPPRRWAVISACWSWTPPRRTRRSSPGSSSTRN